jgi:hypothetical protein
MCHGCGIHACVYMDVCVHGCVCTWMCLSSCFNVFINVFANMYIYMHARARVFILIVCLLVAAQIQLKVCIMHAPQLKFLRNELRVNQRRLQAIRRMRSSVERDCKRKTFSEDNHYNQMQD